MYGMSEKVGIKYNMPLFNQQYGVRYYSKIVH